jgi:hypothetical protein
VRFLESSLRCGRATEEAMDSDGRADGKGPRIGRDGGPLRSSLRRTLISRRTPQLPGARPVADRRRPARPPSSDASPRLRCHLSASECRPRPGEDGTLGNADGESGTESLGENPSVNGALCQILRSATSEKVEAIAGVVAALCGPGFSHKGLYLVFCAPGRTACLQGVSLPQNRVNPGQGTPG